MLALTREYKPSGFDTDFHVIARPGVKGSHSIVPADAARAARHADAVKSLVRDYKRYRDVHEDLQRMVAAAVDKGHLPAYALLELATRVPRLPSAINKHLAAVSFFKKDRHYTTAEVELLRMRYDAAAGWLGKNRPVLNKRIKSLRHDHIFMAEAIQTASKDYTKAMDADTRLSSRESYVLQAQLTLGSWAWRPND
ncbi:MAG: hypothetical protein EOP85_18840 [Verrucomicrobiaceae bacterium]|nr:MAG: hypothetical protein EOP85_18840 [Verrucomicrobiaceae bacterium]